MKKQINLLVLFISISISAIIQSCSGENNIISPTENSPIALSKKTNSVFSQTQDTTIYLPLSHKTISVFKGQ